jgi:hypothetical protein
MRKLIVWFIHSNPEITNITYWRIEDNKKRKKFIFCMTTHWKIEVCLVSMFSSLITKPIITDNKQEQQMIVSNKVVIKG